MCEYKKIELKKDSGVAVIRLNSPGTMNALDKILFDELQDATDHAASDEAIGAIIITGSGRAFCAGGDLKRFADGFTAEEGYLYMKGFSSWVRTFANISKPTIAAVNGYAVGAGFCISLLADIVIASRDAKFGMAFVNTGLIPDFGGLYTLPRIVGLQKAKELVFTGRNISADEAMDAGIVNIVVDNDLLDAEAYKFAKQLSDGPRVAHRMAKMLINNSTDMTLDQMLDMEQMAQSICMQTEDHKNSVAAFLKKGKPLFRGR